MNLKIRNNEEVKQSKQSVIGLYCHYTGFSSVLIERITSDNSKDFERRWTVAKCINGSMSYVKIDKALEELRGNNIVNTFYNTEVDIKDRIKHNYYLKSNSDKNIIFDNNFFNTQVCHLIAMLNDKGLVFKKDVEHLIQNIKYYNPENCTNDLKALIIAVSTISPHAFGMNNLLNT